MDETERMRQDREQEIQRRILSRCYMANKRLNRVMTEAEQQIATLSYMQGRIDQIEGNTTIYMENTSQPPIKRG